MSTLIDALIKEGLVSKEQLDDAWAKQVGAKRPLQELLVEMNFVKEEDLLRVSSEVFHLSTPDLDKEAVDPSVAGLLAYELAKRHGVFPLRQDKGKLIVAMSNPQDCIALDDIKAATHLEVLPVLCPASKINQHIEKRYQAGDSIYDVLKNIDEDADVELPEGGLLGVVVDSRGAVGRETPIVKLLNLILSNAIKDRASDIHFEPQEGKINVRYRIDGELRAIIEVPSISGPALISRIKILAGLDIAESRKPQDGRIKITAHERKIDLRISTIPTFYGEKVEIRILDPQQALVDLSSIGFEAGELAMYREAITSPQGIILITGPTGSGKTSTLYATLNSIKSEKKNIVTIEDPIEYLVDGVNHVQVNPAKNITFANGLRSILRQDPNVIFVGEIRDQETADIAFKASLTGHLVFSTLHTNSAAASIARLFDIGLEPYLIASSLKLVVAQRLVKVICDHCKQEYSPGKGMLDDFKKYIDEENVSVFFKGQGCKECGFTGYLGRSAIFEVMRVNDEIRKLISDKANESSIMQAALDNGSKPMIKAGMQKVAQGITTLEEVSRVVEFRETDKVVQKSRETGEKIRVLIADDEEDILMVLEKRLLAAGYEVIKARDGIEEVGLAYRQQPDLIISDVTMPKMNGFEAVKALRSELKTAVIPVILLTARQDKESELRGLDVGADDYVTKPFDADKLLARVKILLRRKAKL